MRAKGLHLDMLQAAGGCCRVYLQHEGAVCARCSSIRSISCCCFGCDAEVCIFVADQPVLYIQLLTGPQKQGSKGEHLFRGHLKSHPVPLLT
jgi:hypothetical protein